jgi:glycosyltransferase involved in cell wall biosynthesis
MNPIISLIIPFYKNSENIDSLHDSLVSLSFPKLKWDVELIFVDDGSPDDSLERMKMKAFPGAFQVQFIKLSRNFGQQNAFLAGLGQAKGNVFVNLSADLQDDPEILFDMLEAFSTGSEIVICHRASRADGLLSNIVSQIAYKFLRHEVSEIPSGGFDYFLIGKKARAELLNLKGKYRYLQSDILSLGFPITFIPYARRERKIGKSSYSFKKKFQIFINALLDSSFGMINFLSLIGLLVSFCGILLGFSVIVGYLLGQSPFQGFTPILSSLLILNGLTIFTLGVLGQYIWRIYDISRNRPDFVIEAIDLISKKKS